MRYRRSYPSWAHTPTHSHTGTIATNKMINFYLACSKLCTDRGTYGRDMAWLNGWLYPLHSRPSIGPTALSSSHTIVQWNDIFWLGLNCTTYVSCVCVCVFGVDTQECHVSLYLLAITLKSHSHRSCPSRSSVLPAQQCFLVNSGGVLSFIISCRMSARTKKKEKERNNNVHTCMRIACFLLDLCIARPAATWPAKYSQHTRVTFYRRQCARCSLVHLLRSFPFI